MAAYSLYDWEQTRRKESLVEFKRDLFFIAALIALQIQYSLRHLSVCRVVSRRRKAHC
jgi:hypothetical protein